MLQNEGPVRLNVNGSRCLLGTSSITMVEKIDEFFPRDGVLVGVESRPIGSAAETGDVGKGWNKEVLGFKTLRPRRFLRLAANRFYGKYCRKQGEEKTALEELLMTG